MIVRFSKKSEYLDVLRLVSQVHSLHVDLRPDIFNNIDSPLTEEDYYKMVDSNSILVLIQNDKIIGYASIYIKESKNYILCKRKVLYIDAICIDNKYRHNGYGKKLLDYIKSYATQNGCDSIELQVSMKNDDAFNFYKNNLFRIKESVLEYKLK